MTFLRHRATGLLVAALVAALTVSIQTTTAEAAVPAFGDVISFGDEAREIEIDTASGLAYVTTAASTTIRIVNPATRKVVDQFDVAANAAGLSVSPDGSLLYVALNGAGAVAEVDTATFATIRTLDVNVNLDDPRTWDVQVIGNDLFVSGNPGSNGLSYIVKVDLATAQSQRVASNRVIRGAPYFAWDGSDALLVGEGFSPNSLYRLDLSQEDAPLVAEDDHGAVGGAQHAVFASNGDTIVTAHGEEIDPQDLSVIGSVPEAWPATLGGPLVFFADFMADRSLRIRRYSMPNHAVTKAFNTSCANLDEVIFDFKVMPGNEVFLASFDTGLCIVNVSEDFPKCGGMAPTIVGNTLGNELVGTPGDDVILGLAGKDELWGLGGNDRLCGGSGNDELRPGDGDDRAFGGRGRDTLSYVDVVGPLMIDIGANVVEGSGNEIIAGFEKVHGTNGDDVIRGSSGNDVLDGRNGFDTIFGFEGRDRLIGGPRDDVLFGGIGNDRLVGDDGDDVLHGGPGKDRLEGGGEDDLASYEFAPGPVVINLEAKTVTGEGGDTLVSMRGAVGSAYDDVIRGDAGPNLLIGFGGDDEIRGLGGDDRLDGWTGDDTIYGGGGDDIIWGYDGIDQLFGGVGADLLLGEKGQDAIDGGPGADAVSYANAAGAVSIDLRDGTASGEGSDTLTSIVDAVGGPGNDVIKGNAAGNVLIGLEGNDDISGRGGDDGLDGREGSDILRGGDGTDECYNGESHFSCEAVFDLEMERLANSVLRRISWRHTP